MVGFCNRKQYPTIRFDASYNNFMQGPDHAHEELLHLILEAAKSLAEPVKERIALAAVHYDDGREDYTFQKAYGVKTGFVVGVFRHPMANDLLYLNPRFKKTMVESTALVTELDYRVTQGFITTTGRFVGRKEAYQIALDAGQINPDDGYDKQLFSEDICPHQAYHTSGKPIER